MFSRALAAARVLARPAAAAAVVATTSCAFAAPSVPFGGDVPADYVDRLAWRKRTLLRKIIERSDTLGDSIGSDAGADSDAGGGDIGCAPQQHAAAGGELDGPGELGLQRSKSNPRV